MSAVYSSTIYPTNHGASLKVIFSRGGARWIRYRVMQAPATITIAPSGIGRGQRSYFSCQRSGPLNGRPRFGRMQYADRVHGGRIVSRPISARWSRMGSMAAEVERRRGPRAASKWPQASGETAAANAIRPLELASSSVKYSEPIARAC
jgi:hypothetical protein